MDTQRNRKQIPIHTLILAALPIVALGTLFLAFGCKKKPTDPPPPDPPPGKAVNIEVNGLYHRAVMGSDTTFPLDSFRIVDANHVVIPNQWIKLQILEGDGSLLSDSINTGAGGSARMNYTFNGLKGHALIRALAPLNVDTVDVVLRANTIIPGDNGQGQYVRLTDNYRTVKALNGLPDAIVNTIDGILIADYEQSAGVVVLMYDTDDNGIFYDTSSVFMVIMSNAKFLYTGKTKDSIGIGSGIAAIRAIYGTPDTVYLDPAPPPAIVVEYFTPRLRFWCSTADTVAFQIDIEETTNTMPSGKLIAKTYLSHRRQSDRRIR
jgi:hypothetical protein